LRLRPPDVTDDRRSTLTFSFPTPRFLPQFKVQRNDASSRQRRHSEHELLPVPGRSIDGFPDSRLSVGKSAEAHFGFPTNHSSPRVDDVNPGFCGGPQFLGILHPVPSLKPVLFFEKGMSGLSEKTTNIADFDLLDRVIPHKNPDQRLRKPKYRRSCRGSSRFLDGCRRIRAD
jgi:hypothetical protein